MRKGEAKNRYEAVLTEESIAIFEKSCPNCKGAIDDSRLKKSLVCKICAPRIEEESPDYLCMELLALDVLKGDYEKICSLKEEEKDFENFFRKIHKSVPWSLQRAWFRRFFLKRSFALLAPTGIGKTTFGLTLALYLARKKHKKSYLIFPTRLLVEQAINKLKKMGASEEELLYFGEKNLTKKQKNERIQRLQEGNFKILISTSMFLYRNIEILPKGQFELIFVDDVDSFLKTAKNIDKVLYLLGFDKEDIEKALRIIKLKKQLNQKAELWEEIVKEEEELQKIAQEKRKGVLIVSSATSNPRSERIKLFRELLGFEVGRPLFYLRNIVDTYEDKFLEGKQKLEDHKPLWEFAVQFIKKHPKGGLIYISQDRGKEEVEKIIEYLNSQGLNVKSYEELDKYIEDYEKGKVNAFVGIASYRNPLARGFDMPHVIRYALFIGVPKLKFNLKVEKNLSHILWSLLALRPLIIKDKDLKEKYLVKLDRWIEKLRKYSFLSEEFIEQNPNLKEIIEKLREEIRKFIENPEILQKIKESDEITLQWNEKEGYSLVVADVTGYLQASGRTSRLYAGGLTKGFSLVLVDDIKAFSNLKKKVKWFSDEIEFKKYSEINEEEIFQEIEKDRQKVLKFIKGEIPKEVKELIKPVLVIVESPNIARTIANFFGKPLRRKIGDLDVMEVSLGNKFLSITASAGHIYDLIINDKDEKEENIFHGVLIKRKNSDIEKFIPIYEPIEGKENRINSLCQASLEVAEVYIGTDPDSITGDSIVLIRRNENFYQIITVEKLFEELKKEIPVEIKRGHEYLQPKELYIPTVDKNLKIKFGKVKYLIRHKVRKPIYRIITETGREIKITGDHSIFQIKKISDKKISLQEVKPTQLKEGDEIVVNQKLPISKEKIQEILVEKKELIKTLGEKEISVKSQEEKEIILTLLIIAGYIPYIEKKEGEYLIKITQAKTQQADIATEKIKTIETLPLEEQYVYDFETEFQNFIANNILCHNTEGEKIAWDLYEVIKPYNPNIKRMEFHEVTKRAIINAIENPRKIDENLVKAQIVRRIADRWVGFQLSKLIQEHFQKHWLSAGRVQTPVLGWVIERDKLYKTKKGTIFVYLPLKTRENNRGVRIRRTHVEWAFQNKKLARKFYKLLTEVEIKIISSREEEKKPTPPYTTDTMLKDASEKLKFSATKTMQLAQELFEWGFITYMRTDSTRVSDVGISIAKEYISENLGEEYFYPRHWGEGGAHECIRPTHPWDIEEIRAMMLAGQTPKLTRDHLRLYELIFKRFMASQMKPIKVEITQFKALPYLAEDLKIEEEVPLEIEKEEITKVIEEGFNLMSPIDVYSVVEGKYKVLEQKEEEENDNSIITNNPDEETAIKIYKLVPLAYPYTQGTLIKEMKRRGIGRPSTYAQIVQKLIDRGYVIENKNFLFPTKLGKEVYNYLTQLKSAEKFVKEEFTRILEELMDKIEKGEVYYIHVLKDLYEEVLKVEKAHREK